MNILKKRRIKRKKLKLKKRALICSILIIIGLVLISLPYFLINIELYGDKKMVLDYGEKYSEPGFRGNLFSDDITKNIEVTNDIKEEVGTYYVKYKYKLWIFTRTVKRIIEVKDLSSPKIELTGGENFEVTINTEYVEPGYNAFDNMDGDITKKVKVTNNIDITKLGDYTVNYEVADSSGNNTRINRNVKVERLRPTQMSLSEYTLDGWYSDAYLTETKDMGNSYFDSFKLVGDSNTMYFYTYGYLKGINSWAIPCLHAESMLTKELNIYGLGIKIKLLDAVKKYKPKRMIINFGSFSTSWIKEDVFLKNANDILDKIKEINPDTEIVLISIYPIAKKLDNVKFSQDKINKYNFYILEMAHEHGLKFLDVQSVLKGKDGYVNSKYIESDGYHLTHAGHSLVKNYIKTHAIKED